MKPVEELWNQRHDQAAREILARIFTAHMLSWLFVDDSRHGDDPSSMIRSWGPFLSKLPPFTT
jgi:hypothetical protein